MATTHAVPARIRHWLSRSTPDTGTDADLVRRFATDRDESAFAILVDRHGPMVLGVARRASGDHHTAEDVFQATFLALARRAHRLRRPEVLPAWLHRTAHHLGLNAARDRKRRRRAETGSLPPQPADRDELSARELLAILDEELDRLADAFRLPLVLCCLEGLTQDEVAARLGWTPGSVRGRLERGRARLRDRLARRGLSFAVGVGASLLVATPAVAAPLREAVVRAVASGAVPSPTVAALADTIPAIRAGWWMTIAASVLAAGLALAVGLGAPGEADPVPAPAPRAADAADKLPDGAIARLGWSPRRIGNAAFALTSDEKEIVTVASEGIVCRFDAATGKLLDRRQLTTRDDISAAGQTSAKLSADGKIAVINEWVGNDLRVTVWDVPASKVLFRRVPEKGRRLGQYALSPDGKVLALREDVGQRTILRAYDVASGQGKDIGELEYNVYDMQFSADGKRLVLSEISSRVGEGAGQFLTCFDVSAGKRIWKLPAKNDRFAFSPDGRTVAFADYNQRQFHLIETDADGKATERNQECGSGVNHPNVTLMFAPDNRTLVSDYFDAIVLWDVKEGKEINRIRRQEFGGGGYGPKLGAFSADGKTVVTNYGSLQRWDLSTGKPLFDSPPNDGLGGPVEHMSFTPDGQEVFASAWSLDSGRWNVATGKQSVYQKKRFGHQYVTTPAGVRSVWSDIMKPHEVTVYDPLAGTTLDTIRWTAEKEFGINGVRTYALAADGRTLLVVQSDEPASYNDQKSYVTAHDIATGRRLNRFTVPGRMSFAESPFSPCGRWVVLAGKVYHVRTGTELFAPVGEPGERLKPGGRNADGPVWFSADGRLLAGWLEKKGGEKDTLAVWELASGKMLARLAGSKWTSQVVFGPDGRTVARVDARGVRLHDLLTGRQTAAFSTPDINCDVNERGAGAQTAVFSPDGRTLATGHRDGSLTLWAVPRAEPVTPAADVWADLGAESPMTARAAVDAALRDPAVMKLLAAKFRPATETADAEVAALIKKLDDDEFAVREEATKKLRELGTKAEQSLRNALAGASAEAKPRIEKLLAGLPAPVQRLPLSGETLRGARVMEVLERIGTPDARELLAAWADQTKDMRLAGEARSALGRLGSVGARKSP